ncbi:MAG: hypothetical protein BroJett042_11710 [Bacteroidota bacterium]|nr:MAG: hypothetical protein BroJett042_11710 [Bacteroidota bacterium]
MGIGKLRIQNKGYEAWGLGLAEFEPQQKEDEWNYEAGGLFTQPIPSDREF